MLFHLYLSQSAAEQARKTEQLPSAGAFIVSHTDKDDYLLKGGWLYMGKVEVTDHFVWVGVRLERVIAGINAERTRLMADHQQKLTDLTRREQELLCITHDPKAAQ
jgi:hypothetical protein